MAQRRHLPVLKSEPAPHDGGSDGDDDATPRPPWHWVGFGTVAIFAAWLPLAYVAGAVSARVMASRFGADASRESIDAALAAMTSGERARLMAVVALPSLFGLALAAFGGGVVVGRFGVGTGAREAAWAGALTAVIASAIAWAGFTASSLVAAAVTLAVAVGFGAWGGKVGARHKRSAGGPSTSEPKSAG